jgi:hypothetical protein
MVAWSLNRRETTTEESFIIAEVKLVECARPARRPYFRHAALLPYLRRSELGNTPCREITRRF